MKRLKYGIVGAGFVGPHHIDAVRRLGFVDIAALAASNLELARRKAAQLFVPRAYGSYPSPTPRSMWWTSLHRPGCIIALRSPQSRPESTLSWTSLWPRRPPRRAR